MLDILCTTLLPDFYQINLQDFSNKNMFASRAENNASPDQSASKLTDLDLHCFQIKIYPGLAWW